MPVVIDENLSWAFRNKLYEEYYASEENPLYYFTVRVSAGIRSVRAGIRQIMQESTLLEKFQRKETKIQSLFFFAPSRLCIESSTLLVAKSFSGGYGKS